MDEFVFCGQQHKTETQSQVRQVPATAAVLEAMVMDRVISWRVAVCFPAAAASASVRDREGSGNSSFSWPVKNLPRNAFVGWLLLLLLDTSL